MEISNQVVPPSVEYCHLTIEPVLPLKVTEPLLLPEQTVAEPAVLPATVVALTVTVVLPDNDWLQVVVVF